MSGREHPFYDMHRHGFVRVATSTPRVRTADVACNVEGIIAEARRAHQRQVDLLVFPELCVSSYALDDLLLQAALLDAVEQGLAQIAAASEKLSAVLLVGAPLRHNGRLYNCALAIADGHIIGAVPKSYLPNYREFYEKRWFAHGRNITGQQIRIGDVEVPFGTDLIFASNQLSGFKLFIEICEDFWAARPAFHHRRAGRGDYPRQPVRPPTSLSANRTSAMMLCRAQSSRTASAPTSTRPRGMARALPILPGTGRVWSTSSAT